MPKLPKQKRFKSHGYPVSHIDSICIVGLASRKPRFWRKWQTFTTQEYFTGPVAFHLYLELDKDWGGHTNIHIATQDGESYWELVRERDVIRTKAFKEFEEFMRHLAGMSKKPMSWRERLNQLSWPCAVKYPHWPYDVTDTRGTIKAAIRNYAASLSL